MSDTLETVFDEFADVTEKSILSMSEQLRGFRAELDLIRQEQRSALVQAAASGVEGRSGPPGHDGLDGKDGKDGTNGKDGRDGVDGKDGARGSDGLSGRDGVDGKNGAPGERGADGLSSPEEIRAFVAAERALQWREFYLGVFRPDNDYKRGQAVTWNGSMWIALEDTRSMPDTDKSWLLAVKHGRDASHGRK